MGWRLFVGRGEAGLASPPAAASGRPSAPTRIRLEQVQVGRRELVVAAGGVHVEEARLEGRRVPVPAPVPAHARRAPAAATRRYALRAGVPGPEAVTVVLPERGLTEGPRERLPVGALEGRLPSGPGSRGPVAVHAGGARHEAGAPDAPPPTGPGRVGRGAEVAAARGPLRRRGPGATGPAGPAPSRVRDQGRRARSTKTFETLRHKTEGQRRRGCSAKPRSVAGVETEVPVFPPVQPLHRSVSRPLLVEHGVRRGFARSLGVPSSPSGPP